MNARIQSLPVINLSQLKLYFTPAIPGYFNVKVCSKHSIFEFAQFI